MALRWNPKTEENRILTLPRINFKNETHPISFYLLLSHSVPLLPLPSTDSYSFYWREVKDALRAKTIPINLVKLESEREIMKRHLLFIILIFPSLWTFCFSLYQIRFLFISNIIQFVFSFIFSLYTIKMWKVMNTFVY